MAQNAHELQLEESIHAATLILSCDLHVAWYQYAQSSTDVAKVSHRPNHTFLFRGLPLSLKIWIYPRIYHIEQSNTLIKQSVNQLCP